MHAGGILNGTAAEEVNTKRSKFGCEAKIKKKYIQQWRLLWLAVVLFLTNSL